MRRLRSGVAALTAGLVLAAGGCGVPRSGAPIDRGTAPPALPQGRSGPQAPEGPDGALTAQDLVRRYLQAAAWGNSKSADRPGAIDDAELRLRGFFTSEAVSSWSPGDRELNLVRVALGDAHPAGDGSVTVDATLEPVGVLDEFGSVHPASDPAPVHTTFRAVPTDHGRGWRFVSAPSGFYLDVAQLNVWYTPRTIYFWAAGSDSVLVPDTRYMPTAVIKDKQANEIWRWLAKGPSDPLAPAVAPLPDNVNLKDKIVTEQERGDSVLVVNLTSEAAGVQQLQDLMVQFRWSMRPSDIPVQLRIEGVRKDVDGSSSRYLRANPAVWPAEQREPEKLFVLDRSARPVAQPVAAGPTVLNAKENRDVDSAALARFGEQQLSALVRQEPDSGRLRLWLGRITAQGDARMATYRQTEVVGATMSRPVWLSGSTPRVMVAVDGQLMAVTAEGQATGVATFPGGPTAVTAVAAAPDGRRIALITGGQAGVATLRVDGDVLSLRGYRPLAPGLAEARGIDWSREDTVLVGGRAVSGSPLILLAVDGTRRIPVDRAGLPGMVITKLVAYPNDPTAPTGDQVQAMFEAGGQAYNVFSQTVQPLVPLDASPSTSPGAQQVPVPTAPFFHESL
jgi:hypothetical protein